MSKAWFFSGKALILGSQLLPGGNGGNEIVPALSVMSAVVRVDISDLCAMYGLLV